MVAELKQSPCNLYYSEEGEGLDFDEELEEGEESMPMDEDTSDDTEEEQ